jgi:hypothetical protein
MGVAQLILEYLKVLLSPQVVIGMVVVAFFCRFSTEIVGVMKGVASIRLPGGTQLSLQQQPISDIEKKAYPVIPTDAPTPQTPDIQLTPEKEKALRDELKSVSELANLWEYRYLNFFLVPATKSVLYWLAGNENGITYSLYDAMWLPIITSKNERNTIINVLQTHNLISIEGSLIKITPKGKDYIAWDRQMTAAK